MTYTLHFHPLSSFCQKALIGLYELDVAFDKQLVNLMDPRERDAFLKLWPIGKFPVLQDHARGVAIAESSIILEFLDQTNPRGRRLIPAEPERALRTRMQDRFFDLYVNMPLGKIVTDELRPPAQRDQLGVQQADAQLRTAYALADSWMRDARWAAGDDFSMADCAAAPALFYADKLIPLNDGWPALAAYFARLCERPSIARVFDEAKPYLAMFPK